MNINQIVPAQWMLVPRETRERIAAVFSIGKSGITEVFNQEVVTDGRTLNDLSVITLEMMSEYVGSTGTFGRLWELTIAKAFSEMNEPVGIIAKESIPVPPVNVKPVLPANSETPEERKARVKLARQIHMKKVHAARRAAAQADKIG